MVSKEYDTKITPLKYIRKKKPKLSKWDSMTDEVTKMAKVFKYFFKSSSTFDAMAPVIYLGGLLGMTPFTYKFSSVKPKIIISLPFSITSLTLLSIYFYYIIVFSNFSDISYLKYLPPVFKYSENTQIYCGFFAIVTIHIMKYWNRDYLAKHFEITEKLDEMFKDVGCERNNTLLKLKFFIASILEFIFCVSLFGLTYLAARKLPAKDQIPLLFVVFWPTFTISLAQFIISSFIITTWINLQTLNNAIRKSQLGLLIPSVSDASNMLYNKETYGRKLKTEIILQKLDFIWKCYDYICKNSSIVNDYFHLIKLAVITESFFNTLFNAFYLICVLYAIPKSLFPRSVMFQVYLQRVIRCLVNAVNLFFIAVVCNICENEASIKKVSLRISEKQCCKLYKRRK